MVYINYITQQKAQGPGLRCVYCPGDKALGIMGALTGGLVCFVWMGRCLKASGLLPFSVLIPNPPTIFFLKKTT